MRYFFKVILEWVTIQLLRFAPCSQQETVTDLPDNGNTVPTEVRYAETVTVDNLPEEIRKRVGSRNIHNYTLDDNNVFSSVGNGKCYYNGLLVLQPGQTAPQIPAEIPFAQLPIWAKDYLGRGAFAVTLSSVKGHDCLHVTPKGGAYFNGQKVVR